MKSSLQEEIIDHTAKDLFKIVLDIEKYPEFIPWCKNVKIKSKSKDRILADMIVSFNHFLTKTFTSHVFYNFNQLSINTEYIEGPLKDLKTEWIFESLEEKKTKVLFNVKFEFQKFLHQKLAELFFDLIKNQMIDSFKKRADTILD